MISFKIHVKERTLKAGTIILRKDHNWFKRLLAKLCKKELPYNKFELVDADTIYYYFGKDIESTKVAIPKKAYSVKEIKKLEAMLQSDNLFSFTTSVKDIIVAINTIRPNTFKENLTEVLTSKFYTIEAW